ncbi:hypothetical protein PSN13_02363 [Micromonospora saelicesensis]|uniref:Uncharacterized protein n=1 Tax=Micromonospora saelicesensis TaxID=285676 RepID=A0A328NWN3_9ACTN|nr:hypothetical protein [Micromonospora saelicesensis]RAO35939.1 hypothetical protein PSN13_02363 [Micromonospora saelicesensis]
MVTRRIAELLLELAARRWPTEVRDDLRREWAAELHVLAEGGHRTRMLGFAVSLAVSRTGTPIVDRSLMRGRVGRTAAALLLSPLACAAIVFASAVLMNVVLNWMRLPPQFQLPLWSLSIAGLAVVLALYAARWARRTALGGPLRIALGVVLPIGAVVALGVYSLNTGGIVAAAPGLLLWLAGLTLVLWAAATLSARGRVRAAWWLGVLGALVVADLAVILFVVGNIPGSAPVIEGTAGDAVDRISAPLWLFACWTDWNFGLPRPTRWEIFLITDEVLVEPMFYLACTPYVLAYTIRAARSAPTVPVALAPTPV